MRLIYMYIYITQQKKAEKSASEGFCLAPSTALAGILGVNLSCAVLCVSAVIVFSLVSRAIDATADDDDAVVEEEPVHLGELMENRSFCLATAAGIADSFSSASLYIFIPLLLKTKGIDLQYTLYFNVIFFAGYMSGRLALGRLADKYGAPRTLMASKIAMAALILLLTLASGSMMLATLLFLLGIFTRGSAPVIRAMVADSMDERSSFHNAFSAFSSASRGASAVSRPIFGFLASYSIFSVFYTAAAVSLMTLYPAAKYKNLAPSPAMDDLSDPQNLSMEDLSLIESRLELIEELETEAMDHRSTPTHLRKPSRT